MSMSPSKLGTNPAPAVEASPVTGEYDIAPFREAFHRSGLSVTEVARRLGWMRPDQPRAAQALGLHPSHIRGGRRAVRVRVCHHTAVALCEALGVDPVDVGL